MNSLLRTVGLLGALAVVVGGITFLLQYTTNPTAKSGGGGNEVVPPPPPTARVVFPRKVYESQPGVDGEYELGSHGHRDYVFYPTEKEPVYLGLEDLNCTCLGKSIAFCQLSQADTERFLAQAVAAQVGTSWMMVPLLHFWDHDAIGRLAEKSGAAWVTLEKLGSQARAEPHRIGLVRLNWKGEREGPIRLFAEVSSMNAEKPGGPRPKDHRLEMVMAFVPPVRVFPTTVGLGDLNPRESRSEEVICWSATRPEFKLAPKSDALHPCCSVAVRPLADADRERWAEKMAQTLKSRLLSGYVVTITVHERVSDKVQLDLGPIRQKVELTSDDFKALLAVTVEGHVRGEITLNNLNDRDQQSPNRDRLVLGNFPSKTGKQWEFIIESDKVATELASEVVVEPPTLNYLQVKMGNKRTVGSGAQWPLTITIPPNRAFGAISPRDCAVVLKILSDPPRQVRIPLSGVAIN